MYSKILLVPVSRCEITIIFLFEKVFTVNIIGILRNITHPSSLKLHLSQYVWLSRKDTMKGKSHGLLLGKILFCQWTLVFCSINICSTRHRATTNML